MSMHRSIKRMLAHSTVPGTVMEQPYVLVRHRRVPLGEPVMPEKIEGRMQELAAILAELVLDCT